jgi:hypothetical protein
MPVLNANGGNRIPIAMNEDSQGKSIQKYCRTDPIVLAQSEDSSLPKKKPPKFLDSIHKQAKTADQYHQSNESGPNYELMLSNNFSNNIENIPKSAQDRVVFNEKKFVSHKQLGLV